MYQKVARKVAEQVGQVFAKSHEGRFDCPSGFCVGGDLQRGWISNVIGYSESRGSESIMVQYNAMDLQCS